MELDHLYEQALAAYSERLKAAVARMREVRTPEDFTAAERELHALTRELAADMTERVLSDACADKERRRLALASAREVAAARGIEMRTEKAREVPIRTLSGQVIRVRSPSASAIPRGGKRRARGSSGTGVHYVLDELGIRDRSTPALRLLVSHAVCEANSVTAAREVLAKSGVEVPHKTALRLTYVVADAALRARAKAIKRGKVGPKTPLAGKHVVASIDGGRLNTRRRTGGAWTKGGRRNFETNWREPKVLSIYVVDEQGKRDKKLRTVLDATLGDADAAFELLTHHLVRLGAKDAKKLTFVADGAPWIWARTDALREELALSHDQFTEVLDYFHAVERLGEIADRTLTGDDDAKRAWLGILKGYLKAGDVEAIERALHSDREEPGVATDLAFLDTHRERLRYQEYRSAGHPIGSGAVESAVRRVVNLRMKGPSVFWTEEHAEGILHLRAHAKSRRWDELEARVHTETRWRPTSRVVRAA